MPLSKQEADERLKSLPDWERDGNEIERKLRFADLRAAMAFVNGVAEAAEAADHHPDIKISYNRVKLTLSTHSEGGLTEKDFALAVQIDEIAARRDG